MEVACFVFRSDVLVLVCTSLKSRGYILVLWDFFFFFLNVRIIGVGAKMLSVLLHGRSFFPFSIQATNVI